MSAVAKATGIPGGSIGKIRVKENSTLVDIPQEHVQHAMKEIAKTTIKGHAVEVFLEQEEIIDVPRKRSSSSSRDGGRSRREGSSTRGRNDRGSSDGARRRRSDDSRGSRDSRRSGETRRAK